MLGPTSPTEVQKRDFHRAGGFCREQGTHHSSVPREVQRPAKEETMREDGAFVCERARGSGGVGLWASLGPGGSVL